MAPHATDLQAKLRITSVLSRSKIESKLIARHTNRFLDYYADQKVGILKSETEPLEQLIDEVKQTDATGYQEKMETFTKKQDEWTNKNFLLHFSAMSLNRSKSGANSPAPSTAVSRIKTATLEDCNLLIDNVITDLKMADKEPIENWLVTDVSIQSMKLPYGLPHSLKIPLETIEVENEALIDLIEGMNDKFLLLDGKFHTKIEQISDRLDANQRGLFQDGWSVGETALLFHVMTSFKGSSASGLTQLMREMNQRLFPDKSEAEVVRQKYMLQVKQVLEEKRENIVRDWVREKVDLQDEVEEEWEKSHADIIKKVEHSRSCKQQQKRCIQLSAKLHLQAKAKAIAEAKIRALAQPIRKEEDARKEKRHQEELEHVKYIKSAAENYKQIKVHQQQLLRQRAESQKLLLEQVKHDSLAIHKSRVNFRNKLMKKKTEMVKRNEEKKKADELRRARALEDMKYKQTIQYDPENVFSETHASHVRRYETKQRLEARAENKPDLVSFFRDTYFYTTESVLKDRRAKLECKLREAGLIESSYARQILLAMQPDDKPHLKTQIQFSSED